MTASSSIFLLFYLNTWAVQLLIPSVIWLVQHADRTNNLRLCEEAKVFGTEMITFPIHRNFMYLFSDIKDPLSYSFFGKNLGVCQNPMVLFSAIRDRLS